MRALQPATAQRFAKQTSDTFADGDAEHVLA
jgi:hypothetical protein